MYAILLVICNDGVLCFVGRMSLPALIGFTKETLQGEGIAESN